MHKRKRHQQKTRPQKRRQKVSVALGKGEMTIRGYSAPKEKWDSAENRAAILSAAYDKFLK